MEIHTQDAGSPLRPKRVSQIETADVLEVLQPLWQSLPETASRLGGRIENVLDAARAKGYRQGENPARWRGHLKLLLPKRQALAQGHHAALSYEKLPAFMAKLRGGDSAVALALELTILCATRTSETLGARWDEFDLEKRLWTIPRSRMKAGKER
jgi:integrase